MECIRGRFATLYRKGVEFMLKNILKILIFIIILLHIFAINAK